MADLDYNYIGKLVEYARNGDSDAFAELYAATYQKQYIFSYSYMKVEFLAQDALQETYITALKNLHSLKDPKLFVSWLNQINFRVCYNMAIKQAKYNTETAVYADGEMSYVDESVSPENQAIAIDNRRYILQQVMALPYSESQVIFLHYYRNKTIDEIAYILEMSKSTVKRCLSSGKKRLKSMISR